VNCAGGRFLPLSADSFFYFVRLKCGVCTGLTSPWCSFFPVPTACRGDHFLRDSSWRRRDWRPRGSPGGDTKPTGNSPTAKPAVKPIVVDILDVVPFACVDAPQAGGMPRLRVRSCRWLLGVAIGRPPFSVRGRCARRGSGIRVSGSAFITGDRCQPVGPCGYATGVADQVLAHFKQCGDARYRGGRACRPFNALS